ncbi:MAG: hypothetical protein OEY14_18445, partial [Myxococcales bacterium]|nr:hypothetical protein [Myxococcales bacterium]
MVHAALVLGAGGCAPDLGPCDDAARGRAERLVYSDDASGLPAYAGQALLEQSCGYGSYCHAEGAADRLGAPAGMDFDVAIAGGDPASLERLRRGQRAAQAHREAIYQEVLAGRMPPGGEAGALATGGAPAYAGLPALRSDEGRAILAAWLSCGSPVVQGVGPRAIGEVGVIEPAMPALSCPSGLSACAGGCVDLSVDGTHCGACDAPCGAVEVCFAGGCQAGCPAGTIECAGGCVDSSRDPLHCGGCESPCASGESCTAGVCACPSGLSACAGG